MRSHKLVGAVVLAAALVAGCSSSTHPAAPGGSGGSGGPGGSSTPATTASSVPLVSTVRWTKCAGAAGPSGYQCASVPVPRDPSKPARGTIQMAVDRHPATGTRIGSLLVNPGGPGGSGVDFLPEIVPHMPSSLLSRFDIVGFDPPGVARTSPIACLDAAGLTQYFHLDPAPSTAAGFANLVAAEKSFGQSCQARSGAELPYVSTVDAAMDMDVLRQALGDSKLTYLGFSYGTFLGATYADLYPTHVRAMVLDGAIDPGLPVITDLDQQSQAIENQLDQFFQNCANDPNCAWKPGSDPLAAYQALLARVRQSPLPARNTSRTVGPSELLYGTALALYSTDYWKYLQQALGAAEAGDGTLILSLFDAYTGRQADGTYTNLFEANAAINCLDEPAPTVAQIQAANATAARLAPVFGVMNLDSETGCSVWPVPATGRPGPIHAYGSPTIVVVGSTGDPATPYSWAQALASQLQHSVLLTRIGGGHTGYEASSCVRTAVDSYLVDLTPPPVGKSCPSG